MRIEWVILCRYAEENNALATLVGVGVDTFVPPTLPVSLTLTFATKLVGHLSVSGREHVLSYVVLNPDLVEIVRGSSIWKWAPGQAARPGWEEYAIIPTDLEVDLQSPGSYELNVSLDGGTPNSSPFFIYAPSDPTT